MKKFPKQEKKQENSNRLGLTIIKNAKNMEFSFDELNQISLNSFFELMLMEIESMPDIDKNDGNKIRNAQQKDIDSFLA